MADEREREKESSWSFKQLKQLQFGLGIYHCFRVD